MIDDDLAARLRRDRATSLRNAAPRAPVAGGFLGAPGVPELLRLALRLVPVLGMLLALAALGVSDLRP